MTAACPCTRPVVRFHVEAVAGRPMLVVVHEDALCELDLRTEGAATLRLLLRAH